MKKIKKKFLIATLSVLAPLSMLADNESKMVIYAGNGELSEFSIDNVQKITFQDETFTLLFFNNSTPADFRYDEVNKITFDDIASGITEITSDGNEISFSYDGHDIIINGCNEPLSYYIYNISGIIVDKGIVDGDASVRTDSLPKGMYILKTNFKTFKFNKQ